MALQVLWTHHAKQQLKDIFNYYKDLSPQGAENGKNDILEAGRDLVFTKQYQKDEIEPDFRRIIVRHYKLIYSVNNNAIAILRIFDTRQNPDKQINK